MRRTRTPVSATVLRVFAAARDAGTTDDAITEIGESYLSAKNNAGDARVIAAYARLQAETDRLFRELAHPNRRDQHHPARIVFTRCQQPYDSDRELIAAVRTSGVLEITTAALSRTPIHPLLGCEFGGPFDRFRAVHDLIGHAMTGFGFGLDDEIAAWRTQHRLHGPLARRALATEILAINSALSITGVVPEHKATLLEPQVLRRAL
jgi:hypothetical protein